MCLSSCENTFSQKATASYVLRLCAFPLSLSNHIEEDLFIRDILQNVGYFRKSRFEGERLSGAVNGGKSISNYELG